MAKLLRLGIKNEPVHFVLLSFFRNFANKYRHIQLEMYRLEFPIEEQNEILEKLKTLRNLVSDFVSNDDERKVSSIVRQALSSNSIERDVFGLNPILFGIETAIISVEEIGLRRDGVLSIVLYSCQINKLYSIDEIKSMFGEGLLLM